MKKFLLIAVASMIGATAYADTISIKCGTNTYSGAGVLDTSTRTPSNTPLVPASSTIACADFSIAGTNLSDVTLIYRLDYSFAQLNPLNVAIAMDFTPNAGFAPASTNVTRTGLGDVANAQVPNPATASIAAVGNFFAGPSVVLAPGAFSNADTVSASVFVQYTYSIIPPPNGQIPEPSTVALIGAGLVGLATAARRRR